MTSTALEAYLSRLERELRQRGLQDSRIVDEAREHLVDAVEDGLQRGLSVEAAESQALVRFGPPEMVAAHFETKRYRTSTADISWPRLAWASEAVRDARDGLRAMRRTPGFTAVVILTLAIGTGATTAVFAVVNALLLRPLPYPNSQQLVQLIETLSGTKTSAADTEAQPVMNVREFVNWRNRTKTLSGMAVYAESSFTISTTDGAVRAPAARVSPALFVILGVQPMLGRTLDRSDEDRDPTAVVVSATAWRKYLASSRDAIGQPILLDGKPHVVVGVLPDDFSFPSAETALWTVYAVSPASDGEASANVVARLRDGVSLSAAAAEAHVIGNAIAATDGTTPGSSSTRKFQVRRLEDAIVAPFMPALRLLVGVAALVLLIVVANATTLLLSRHIVRDREMAIRRALGADRMRLVRQVVVESLLLSVGGSIAGSAIAGATIWLIKAMAVLDVPELFQLAARVQFGTSSLLPRLAEVRFDGLVLGFAAGISVLASVICGVGPALQTLIGDRLSLVTGAEPSILQRLTRNPRRVESALVIAQLAAATMSLVGAGLLVRSLVNLQNVHPGYDPANVVTFQLVLPAEYDSERKAALASRLCSELRVLPDVSGAGFTNLPPLAGGGLTFGLFAPPGRTLQDMLPERVQPQARAVSPDYLRALGVPLIDGRWIDESDRARHTLLVTRATARRYFGSESPVGAQVRLLPATVPWEIVGVVDDVRPGVPWEQPYPLVFMDSRQALIATAHLPERMRDTAAIGFLSFAVRVNANASPIARDVRSLVRRLDPAAALEGVTTMKHLVSSSMARPRYNAVLFGLLALIAGGLAALGVYAVMTYAVSQRTSEIGIRMALGARPRNVLRLVLAQGGLITLTGVGLGLVAALALSQYLRALLFQVTATDLRTYATVSIGFGAIALAASYVPARRASMLDPLAAIRHE
jgi:putative ABC transport system permease protein